MSKEGATPQEKLAHIESRARLAVTVITVICAVSLFIEFLLSVTLPVKAGYDSFLSFTRVRSACVLLFFFFRVCALAHLTFADGSHGSQSAVPAGSHRCVAAAAFSLLAFSFFDPSIWQCL